MSLAFVVDMNLSAEWIDVLTNAGFTAVHWSQVGNARAADSEIVAWAVANGRVVLTHDLDFGTILATTKATGPSVVLLRGEDVLPDTIANVVIVAISSHQMELASGALMVVDLRRARIRMLPFGP